MPITNIILPKLLALDTSHLGAVARDKASRKNNERHKALMFEKAFENSPAVLLICWHHIQELLTHRDDNVVTQRIAWIRSLPLVATITAYRGDEVPGSIIDIQAFEVRAAFATPAASPVDIRDAAAESIFRFVSGAELIRPVLDELPILRAEFHRQEARQREVVAISKSKYLNISETTIADLLRGKVRPADEILTQLDFLRNQLSHNIKLRGDKRISNPENTSATFFDDVERFGMAAISEQNPILWVLLQGEVDISEIGPDTTVGDITKLAVFRKRLSVINQLLGLPWRELKAKVDQNILPSEIISSKIAILHPNTAEWKGSELTDAHLVCLSAYADVTYVDKRTYEAVRQAAMGSRDFAGIVRDVAKASDYSDIISRIAP